MLRTLFYSSFCVSVCLLALGCNGNKGEVPVAGHLTRGGKPCEGITVSFVPDDMTTPGFTAGSRADGGFEMFSFKGKKGVLPGVYSVQLSIPLDAVGGSMVKNQFLGAGSPWRVTVTDKGIADLQLDMDKEKLE